MPARNDPADVKPNGDVVKAVEANGVVCESVDYAEMVHGFMPRGDLSDSKVVRDVEDAEKRTYEFFAKHL